MKYIGAVLIFLSCFFIFHNISFAHVAGQPAYLIIDGKYVGLYTVPTTSLNDFPLPQDSAPDTYLVNQPIRFEIDAKKLPGVTTELLQKTKFSWKLGDGKNAEGLTVTHTYTKMGSYLLEIYADDGSLPQPQLLESVLFHVLPNKQYKLPTSVITVNGKQSKDPLVNTLSFSYNNPIHLDGSSSEKGSVPIKSYFWDLGDSTHATGNRQDHTYKADLRIVFPVLRVTDENGFISDSFLQVNNQIYDIQNSVLKKAAVTPIPQSDRPSQLRYGILVVILLVGIAGVIVWVRGRKRIN